MIRKSPRRWFPARPCSARMGVPAAREGWRGRLGVAVYHVTLGTIVVRGLEVSGVAEQIVGRRRELDALAAFLEALPPGGWALLFEGDAGIGKTALWQEGSRLARERGVRVLTARARFLR